MTNLFHWAVLLTTGLICSIATAEDVNLALVGKATTSHVSGDTSLTALNDASVPETSHQRGRGSYGNWPTHGTQWVQYQWSQPISTKKVRVFWWDDHRGVRLPAACRVKYWDGDKFVPVSNPEGLGVKASEYNTTTFDEVQTDQLRLEMDGEDDFSTGILEWQVLDSGKSPDFPPTVSAGIDRVVVLGGKTYLRGQAKALNGSKPLVTMKWSKASGQGDVTFADPTASRTTATFSETGRYVLKLTGSKGNLSDSSLVTVQVIEPPPAKHLDLVDTRSYTLNSPLWNDRAKALIVNWIPHCIERISDPDLKEGGINNLVDAANKLAGKPHGKHRGYVFSNAWIYNTIESICVAVMIDPQGDTEIIAAQNAMRQTLEDWIPKVLAAQEADGYLQTYFTLNDLPHWSPRHRDAHEGYVAGYLLEAGIAHYLMTEKNDSRLYDAAKRLADCWCNQIGPAPKQEWFDGHQAMEIALVRFGRFVNHVEGNGRGSKYIDLAKFLLDGRDDGSEYDQSHVPVTEQYAAVGHAVRASYSYAGMADVAMETHDTDYQSAVMSLWDNVVNRKYYLTGGIGSGETSEGFGPDYSLPHNAYCESCSSCGEIFMQHKLHLAHHDAKYADLYEQTLYNALLGSLDIAGKHFYYPNPLVSHTNRTPWHVCPCCVGNIPRTLLMLPTWMYSKSESNLYVNLFVGSTITVKDVDGIDVQLVQTTDYPFRGDVVIEVNPSAAKAMRLHIRMPRRDISTLYTATPEADGATSIHLNGQAITPSIEKGYAVIDRVWKPGDQVELELPMPVQRIKADEKIAATRGQVALRRGPLVYCAEDVDQEMGKAISAKSPLEAISSAEPFGESVGNLPIIHGTWSDGSELTAIPYYLRNNRTSKDASRPARSTVWLKEEP
ncbi:glycoside hydrolase family 127 protein [Novipirellula artificiosorum]|uniref:Non-reducing end beta-L-arabinofuranosidase n=1 Tax=Novipirellula artificiosorum TaxID=2528016 RepID=A0A5C6DQ28_9BACT|nr:beta-L-arabinofuranosidase domain-containing protein [Novipirellula artificiosorum]TWU37126.1 Non-reducing end beta-L-arabinofuranosidase [Novipirellula artificiosorum]